MAKESNAAPPRSTPNVRKRTRATGMPAGSTVVPAVFKTPLAPKPEDAPYMQKRVPLPPQPTFAERGEEKHLYEEQQVARVEALMLKGVQAPVALAKMLQITDRRLLGRYIQRVHARWEVSGGGHALRRYRGEMLAKLDNIEAELWMRVQNAGSYRDDKGVFHPGDDRLVAVCMGQLTNTLKYKGELLGLSADAIARMQQQDEGTNPVAVATDKQARMASLAKAFLALTEARRAHSSETIDASVEEGEPGS